MVFNDIIVYISLIQMEILKHFVIIISMKMTKTLTVFVLIFAFLVLPYNGQGIPISSYNLVSNYTTNPYFQVINQTLNRAYSSYLSQASVSSVYLYTSDSLVSMIITYSGRSGTSYRGTANYNPQTRQLSVQSFGPVATQPNPWTSSAPTQITIHEQENGIGITAASSPPNAASNLIPTPNPAIRNQQISVLLPNSTSTKDSNYNSNSNSDSKDSKDSSSLSSYSSSSYSSPSLTSYSSSSRSSSRY